MDLIHEKDETYTMSVSDASIDPKHSNLLSKIRIFKVRDEDSVLKSFISHKKV